MMSLVFVFISSCFAQMTNSEIVDLSVQFVLDNKINESMTECSKLPEAAALKSCVIGNMWMDLSSIEMEPD